MVNKNYSKDSKATPDLVVHEMNSLFLGGADQGLRFYPFGEVIHCHYKIVTSLCPCLKGPPISILHISRGQATTIGVCGIAGSRGMFANL